MKVRLIASDRNWIEGSAIEQLNKTAQLPGVIHAAGMPDLHPGKDAPIGAVFATNTHIYPHLVDKDIGCGISLWQLDLLQGKVSSNKLERRLGHDLEGPWRGNVQQYMEEENVPASSFDLNSMGTIGNGNHFSELTGTKEILDEERFLSLGLDRDAVFLLIHSGSRGFGESILDSHIAQCGNGGLLIESQEAQAYLTQHNIAMDWARANRKLIARRMMEALGLRGNQILDVSHNHVVPGILSAKECWFHRKGAVPTDQGPVIIAGSRGTLSYLVEGIGDQTKNLSSAAHGAGRKWRRSDCKARLEKRFAPTDLLKTDLGSKVICEDKDLLYEEAPQAYKNIDVVVQDLIDAGLVRTIATFSPIITYKKRKLER